MQLDAMTSPALLPHPSEQAHTVFLALGSNLGDRYAHLVTALRQVRAAVDIRSVSSIYETEPVGYLAQPRFFNLVCCGNTRLPPQELLSFVKEQEKKLGRQASFRNGPRPIDIDIILYDHVQIVQENLVIPHPRMAERAFVLAPLAEIAPEAVNPASGKTARELLQHVSLDGVVKLDLSIAL